MKLLPPGARPHAREWWTARTRLERTFLIFLVLYLILVWVPNTPGLQLLCLFVLIPTGGILLFRFVRFLIRTMIWRLRYRLIVTYLFIAVVPILLLTAFVLGAQATFAHQTALYLVGSELDRRSASLRDFADALGRGPYATNPDSLASIASFYEDKFPGIEVLVENGNQTLRYPPLSTVSPPARQWGNVSGLLLKDGMFYCWAHLVNGNRRTTVMVPLTDDTLSEMIPNLGDVRLMEDIEQEFVPGRRTPKTNFRSTRADGRELILPRRSTRPHLPEAVNQLDFVLPPVPAILSFSNWNQPGKSQDGALVVLSRPSAVIGAIYSQRSNKLQGLLPAILLGIGLLFVLVEAIAFIIGVSLTRSITGAVHELYEGTQRVMEGNFHHRIRVMGRDQLGHLSRSFNTMTERLEQLLIVAKEKERLQSEIEIAREVQGQLYPKITPKMKTLEITASCQPARVVSGDYYDYQLMNPHTLAFAFGDVAGKGISAALLMATLQSNMRTQLHFGQASTSLSPAGLVSQLNVQLHAHTSPEKYATFFFGVYDEETSTLRYTNAGHLPPILFRGEEHTLLSVDGMVVGAFSKSCYEESRITLESGDLLVCYTDGVTEPENAYGEMFGEERMIDAILRNRTRSNGEIIDCVMQEVRAWTGTPELFDDMTMLLLRRL